MSAKEDSRARIRRTLEDEFGRMDDDFDHTQNIRKDMLAKLHDAAKEMTLFGDSGPQTLAVINGVLKAADAVDSSSLKAINAKLRQKEQEVAADVASAERIAAIRESMKKPKIEVSKTDVGELPTTVIKEYEGQIPDYVKKASPFDLNSEE